MWALISANVDIMIRTLLLVFAFAYFTNEAAKYGVVALAATHIVLQIMAFTAFFLDGFAYVAEAETGQSYGAKDKNCLLQHYTKRRYWPVSPQHRSQLWLR